MLSRLKQFFRRKPVSKPVDANDIKRGMMFEIANVNPQISRAQPYLRTGMNLDFSLIYATNDEYHEAWPPFLMSLLPMLKDYGY